MKITFSGRALVGLLGVVLLGCQDNTVPKATDEGTSSMPGLQEEETSGVPNLHSTLFGHLPDGTEVTLFTCVNSSGLTLKLLDYGATVVSVETRDRDAKLENITLGYDDLSGYLNGTAFFGATVGRYCNRIGGAKFSLNEKVYELFANDGDNHLHGGKVGLNQVMWESERIQTDESVGMRFSYLSPDGEEGYPGNLRVTVDYILNDDSQLKVEFRATADQPTPVNLTNHCYWNLGGVSSGAILDHELTINADQYLAVDDGLIPTGELVDVKQTPLDFTSPASIGSRLGELTNEPQGYDHCFVLRSGTGEPNTASPPLAARVRDPKSGRVMEVRTTQPGMQLYSGNFLNGSAAAGGYEQHQAFCLETQHYPDSPNQPAFPSTILQPGEEFHQVTIHTFLVD